MSKFMGWIVVPLLVIANLGNAQERREAAAPQATAPGAAGQLSRADQEIAAVKLAFCRNEIELAKLASQKAQSDEVKQFAAQMVKEHSEGCAKLEKWAGSLASAAPARGAGAEVRIEPGTRPAVDVNLRGAAVSPLNWVAIHQQMAEQCLSMSKQELGKKEGAEFDKCFIGMAIGGHQQAVVADKVFENYASPQFRSELEQCQNTATTHLNEAKQIMEKLASK